MKHLKNTVCAMVLATTSVSIFAMDTAEIEVTGTITPGSCTPTFSNGGVVDFGTIAGADLGSYRFVDLPPKQLDFSIMCGAPRRVAFKLLPGQIGALADSDDEGAQGFGRIKHTMANTTPVLLQRYGTGLGLDASGGKIGGFMMNIRDRESIVDGSTSALLLEGTSSSYAVKSPTTSLHTDVTSTSHYTWGDYDFGGYVPVAFSSAETTLDVYAFLNLRHELDLTQEVNLNGSVIFEIIYL
jgi:hypothetical protein